MGSEAIKGHLDSLILAVIAEGPLHGYAIIEELKRRSGGVFDLPEGTIYPALHRLEHAGLLDSEWNTETGRKRRVYRLTRSGGAKLGLDRVEWQRFAQGIAAVLQPPARPATS